jgi:hypothetical protein
MALIALDKGPGYSKSKGMFFTRPVLALVSIQRFGNDDEIYGFATDIKISGSVTELVRRCSDLLTPSCMNLILFSEANF